MTLNDRKMKILQAIISSYLETAEPVGSRTISKCIDLGLSPATIRNEMADLEELGFIIQPHTSAGRIPSDKGYRFYVDTILNNQELENRKIAVLEDLVERADRIENMLKAVIKVLAKETHYATMISSPKPKNGKIKNIQLISIEATKLLAIIVTDSNQIKNYMVDLHAPVEQTMLNRIAFVMNEHLYGLSLEEINLPIIQNLEQYAGTNAEIIGKVLTLVFETIQTADETNIYTSGTTNILKFPEFSNMDKAMELIDTLEEKDALKLILKEDTDDDSIAGTISIRIGEEIEVDEMKDCSIITTSYHIGGEKVGKIGIIGPKRMDYMHTISYLKELITKMEQLFNKSD